MSKQIVAYHLRRLKDKRAEVRLNAIHELRELADPDALPALEDVFRNDPDPEVRAAAQEAGKAIFKSQLEQKS